MNTPKLLLSCIIWAALMLGGQINAQKGTCQVIENNYKELQVQFTLGKLSTSTLTFDGRSFDLLTVEGLMASGKVGDPNLPTFSSQIEVPICDAFRIDISNARFDTLDVKALGIHNTLMPVQPSRSKSDTLRHTLMINDETYKRDEYCGAEWAMVEAQGIARDRRLARLQISPIRYNAMQEKVIICREMTVTIHYENPDVQGTQELFQRYYSPAFHSGAATLNTLSSKTVSSSTPIRYLIIAHSSFQGQLDSFVEWKRRKGYLTDIVYTSDPSVGTTTTSIAAYTQSQYTNATATNPAPTFLLLVGDVEQIPAFTGTTSSSHITDLYYISWTSGDNLPDCYCGRFSAQTVAQLTPQIEKTLMYEQYTFADPSFLDRAVMVAGVDGGSAGDYAYTYADPAMDYAITHYINGANGFSNVYYVKNDLSIVPTGSNVTMGSNTASSTVRSYYNQGAGWINYSAHGSSTSWGTPNFTTSHVDEMTNTQKFGIMIGNCCLTNRFQTTTCFGESLLRKDNYCGAVNYIGGSNSTYWSEDFYWAVGLRSNISPTMSMANDTNNMGAYDKLCHTHGESYPKWCQTTGALMMGGNMAVESSTSSRKLYYWEIYHIMGDPSIMPYLTQASEMTVTANPTVTIGTTNYVLQAVPYAYVAITDTTTRTLVAATTTDAQGMATLTLPQNLMAGGYELAVTAQQYQPYFLPINVIPQNGPFVSATVLGATAITSIGATGSFPVELVNLGNDTARNIVMHIESQHSGLHLSIDSLTVVSLGPGDTLITNNLVGFNIDYDIEDQSTAQLQGTLTWDNCTFPVTFFRSFQLQAPAVNMQYNSSATNLMPGDSKQLSLSFTNNGHAAFPAGNFSVSTPTALLRVNAANISAVSIATGGSATRQITLTASDSLPEQIFVPVYVALTGDVAFNDTLNIWIGASTQETFENNAYQVSGWTQGTYGWQIVSGTAHSGNYSARSTSTLGHSETAELNFSQTLTQADSISFYYKVSSENGYDKFRFSIDNVELFTASGDEGWTLATYPVSAGSHQYKFSYSKDYSVSSGSDCAWIDDVKLPSVATDVTFTRYDICEGDTIIHEGNTFVPEAGCISFSQTGSTVQLTDYHVHPATQNTDTVAACDSYQHSGLTYTEDCALNEALTDQWGCDSLNTLEIIINHSTHDTVNAVLTGDGYTFDGTTYTSAGEYTMTYSTTEGCDSVIVLVLSASAGIDQFAMDNEQLLLYPNPVHNTATIEYSGADTPAEAILTDAIGRQTTIRIISAGDGRYHLDLSTLPSQAYLLTLVSTSGQRYTTRLLKD